MLVVTRTVVVDAPLEFTFDVSNQIELWPQMMAEYKAGEVFDHQGRKIWFRLTDNNGRQWTSWRSLFRPHFTYAERHEPKAPFEFMHITWTYRALGDKTEMTWDMCFELPPEKRGEQDKWVVGMGDHTESNQAAMKKYIEAQYRKKDS